MKKSEKELLEHVERIVWDINVPDHEKVLCIQNLMYQWEQMCDHRTERTFGDDDAHVNSPNARRM